MDLGGLLSKYLNPAGNVPASDAENHFDQVAQNAPGQTVSQGISDALRSDQTPALGEMVKQAFSRADPQQRAGMLNEILSSLPPGTLSSLGGALGGGALGGILGHLGGTDAGGTPQVTPQVTPQQASQISPQQVQDLANHAETHDSSIFDKLGDFYSRNPDLVKALGISVLGVALSKIAGRARG
jgi:hypothetical protein